MTICGDQRQFGASNGSSDFVTLHGAAFLAGFVELLIMPGLRQFKGHSLLGMREK
jgi:hypothetical protein